MAVSAAAANFEPTTLALGTAAPDFKLTGVDGREYSLKDFEHAKVLTINSSRGFADVAYSHWE